ncbi:MAG TPA: preprotein translocase subunit SecE [Pyrinomonadaceae bacterium]|nr:preprotein translocase subunit SecE [Pyrinomonadaceae bacterium]
MSEAVEGKKKEGVGEFISHTRKDLELTSFPGTEEVRNTVIVVIISVIFFALYLFVVDKAWVYLLDGLTWIVNKLAGF